MNNKTAILTLILVSVAAISTTSILVSYKAQAAVTSSSTTAGTATGTKPNAEIKVGGGNATYPFLGYNPQKVQAKTGDTIVWNAVSPIVEPHTVSFVLDNKTMTAPDVPFAASTSLPQLTAVPPGSNGQPTVMPSHQGNGVIIVGANARANLPTIIDKTGSPRMINATTPYHMDGTEKYVNSGILVEKPQEQFFPGSSNSFAITFEKAGTYDYTCIFHPWMTGQVVVK
jgi:plastocyanin